ncbi:hypothetical protein [Prosthecobacter sp.]|uniref:hypothetical protein n=1 Tax=Prosthecobacter sp. TaxID=1965333 RepID=UPI003783A9CC
MAETISFARDLAIGTYYGDSADPTIVIVNTKTNERTRLRQGQPAANGMKLTSVKSGAGRKDLVVEVTLGSETASIRYNDAYMKQMAASEMAKPSTNPSQTRQPSGPQQKTPPASTPPVKGAPAVTAQNGQFPSDQPGSTAPSGPREAGGPPRPPASPPMVSQAANAGGPPQMPVRNRLTVPVRNAAALSPSSPVPLSP